MGNFEESLRISGVDDALLQTMEPNTIDDVCYALLSAAIREMNLAARNKEMGTTVGIITYSEGKAEGLRNAAEYLHYFIEKKRRQLR